MLSGSLGCASCLRTVRRVIQRLAFTRACLESRPLSLKEDPDNSEEEDPDKEGFKQFLKHREERKGSRENFEGPGPDEFNVFPLIAAASLAVFVWGNAFQKKGGTLSWQKFVVDYLIQGKVSEIVVDRRRNAGLAKLKPFGSEGAVKVVCFSVSNTESIESRLEDLQREHGVPRKEFVPVHFHSKFWTPTAIALAGLGVGAAVLMRGVLRVKLRQLMASREEESTKMMDMWQSMTQDKRGEIVSTDSLVAPESVTVRFGDVAGMLEAKTEIQEFVEFLKQPESFLSLGAVLPKGALLVGPPGTGKTMLARAAAGEASVPFYSINGSDFLELYVGVGPARVRDMFSKARENSPAIIFIDEIDAVARKRSASDWVSGGTSEREATLNALLVEMDGFRQNDQIVVLAATNRMDILDKALLRPGRFDRKILITLPDLKERAEMFSVYLPKLTISPALLDSGLGGLASRLAALSPGLVGADIANVTNEAAILAARRGALAVEMIDFEMAVDRVVCGAEKATKLFTEKDRRLIAVHEAGHAISGWFLEHADPLLKVTIVPRMSGALGFTQSLPKELALHTKEELTDRMVMALGGRAAEDIVFGRISTGAVDDLQRVTAIANAMVTQYGMSDTLGHVGFPAFEGVEAGLTMDKPYSEYTGRIIDEEVRKAVGDAHKRAMALLEEHRTELDAVTECLLAEETISQVDIERLIGARPEGQSTDALRDYVAALG